MTVVHCILLTESLFLVAFIRKDFCVTPSFLTASQNAKTSLEMNVLSYSPKSILLNPIQSLKVLLFFFFFRILNISKFLLWFLFFFFLIINLLVHHLTLPNLRLLRERTSVWCMRKRIPPEAYASDVECI